MGGGVKLTIEIPDDTVIRINHRLDYMPDDGMNTHGKLTLKSLAEMLMEDVVLTITRPGSWEGSKMGDLLYAHGYRGF